MPGPDPVLQDVELRYLREESTGCGLMSRDEYFQESDPTSKVCPFLRTSCIKERCMAWHGSEDLNRLKAEKPEGYANLIQVIGMSEGVSEENAEKILQLRNDDERCLLIKPETVV